MASKINPNSDHDELPSISEINVTPFVDVVLVLLVIFMVTAPMLVREQMNVNLPKTETGEKSASDNLNIALDKAGKIFVKGKELDFATLENDVTELAKKNPQAQTVISADQETKHGDVVRIMDLVKKHGLTHFAIQIERR